MMYAFTTQVNLAAEYPGAVRAKWLPHCLSRKCCLECALVYHSLVEFSG